MPKTALQQPALKSPTPCSPTAATFLVKGRKAYVGDMLLHYTDKALFDNFQHSLRIGKPSSLGENFVQDAWLESYLPWRIPKSLEMRQAAGIKTEYQERVRILDIACGCAINSLALAQASPNVRVTCLDTADVLITNPRLVQTGLDLVSYHTVVFYKPEYNLYTLWQALRRVWRLGQTRSVKAVFAVYKDAMEDQALALMGRKMRAAQLLYGDNVGGAIVPVEEGDFITELAREVLHVAELDDLQSLFADEMNISNSPMGCPTEISPVLIPVKPKTWQEWVLEHQVSQAAQRRSTGKQRAGVQPGQLSIWRVGLEEGRTKDQ